MRESRQTSNEVLTEKPLRRSRSVYPGEEEVVHCCQACPLSGVVKSSQLMMPEQEVSVAPFDLGASALQHLCERFGLVLELVLLPRAQRAQGAPPERSPWSYASFPCMREAGDRRHGDWMPAYASMTVYGHQTYATDIACVLLASAVAPESAGDGIEDRRLGARDTAPQTEHLGESTP
jgi:hypothetical protein